MEQKDRDFVLTIEELSGKLAQALLEKNGWRVQAESLAKEVQELKEEIEELEPQEVKDLQEELTKKDAYINDLEDALNDEMNEPNCENHKGVDQ